jgi:hypothetical protein
MFYFPRQIKSNKRIEENPKWGNWENTNILNIFILNSDKRSKIGMK